MEKVAIYKRLKDISTQALEQEVRIYWQKSQLQEKLLSHREGPPYVFYEGPPSANGPPGLHHLLARTLKDIFCRYKTQQGYRVTRRAGWDTHGLPIELQVEKELGITKEDIGRSISICDYNLKCREAVLRYTTAWEEMTEKMGFWIDMQKAYRTSDSSYVESVWWLLGQLYERDLLYKSYSIQPYSPAAGTALSQHELNQPGCYREVKDFSITAQFKLLDSEKSYFLAWTTTPWTLPANSALAVGKDIVYAEVESCNRYSGEVLRVWLAADCLGRYFEEEGRDKPLSYRPGSQQPLPYKVLRYLKGSELQGWCYAQLMPYVPLPSPAFQVFCADFVNTEEGTGIVHISRAFGEDDNRLCAAEGIPGVFVKDEKGQEKPIVDTQGRFVEEISDFAGMPVKAFSEADEKVPSTDLRIVQKLKAEGKVFHTASHLHSYPHCWRTDRPILYYPIQSWFIRSSTFRSKLLSLNKTIEWQPPSTGEGRFGNWLSQLEDWNLSRSRFWGTPLPIWRSEDGSAERCISSYAELREEVKKAVSKGLMPEPLPRAFDPHRPFVDEIILVGPEEQPLYREPDVIDVWFDSGAMPYAQWHYPFENKDTFAQQFPADFIAEGVDQTRGWFFTLHAIAGMIFDKVAYKRVLSCGLILDKEGRKMSKRLGNAVDPMRVLSTYGSDATRWYLITAASPWESLRFDEEGLAALRRSFFGTLENTFDFFMLYAGIDQFLYDKKSCISLNNRPLIDKWLLSRLQGLQTEITSAYETYSPRRATQLVQRFVTEDLSNWYVRLNRKRFWQGEQNEDKQAAYETLYEALKKIVQLAAPIAPFSTEYIFQQLIAVSRTQQDSALSVHVARFPSEDVPRYRSLEVSMSYAQRISSLVHAIRKRCGIKVRQPLPTLLVAETANGKLSQQINTCKLFILQEVNIKALRFSTELPVSVKKRARPNLSRLGPRYGKQLQAIRTALSTLSQGEIAAAEENGELHLQVDNQNILLTAADLLIDSEDIQGWEIAKDNELTVALDTQLSEELLAEGLAREFVNKIQNLRKSVGLDVQDKISIQLHLPDINNRLKKPNQQLAERAQDPQVLPSGSTATSTPNTAPSNRTKKTLPSRKGTLLQSKIEKNLQNPDTLVSALQGYKKYICEETQAEGNTVLVLCAREDVLTYTKRI